MDLIQILKDKFGVIGSRDRSHLVRKVITNRKGHRQTVLVNPNKNPEPAPKTESRPHTGPNEAANPNLQFVRFDQIREQGQYTAKEDYDRLTIDGLKSRILQHGFNPAFPLQVDSDNGHTFNIVSGHHRYTAVQELISEGKLPADFKIPVVIRQYGSKAERLMAQVGENVRRTVNPLDEAKAIGELANLGQSVAAISEATGIEAGRVRRRLALNNLVPELQQMVRKKDRSLPVGIAEAIGMHGLNEDGSKNSTIQVRAHRFYNANRHRGFGASEVISYVQELKSQEKSQFFEADSLRSDTETEALRVIGSQEKARRNSAQVDKFIGQVQSSFQKLLGDSTGSLNESTIKELATSLIASEGETGFKSKMDRLSALLTDLQSVKNTLEKNYNRIKEESQNHGLFFARSMALIESLTDQVLILKGKAAQVGEIRNWKSGTFRKTNEGWRRQSSASGGASGKESYQHALRSDANQTQKSNRIDLLNAIRNKVENLSRRVGKNSGATLLASSLVGEIETHGSASIIGRAVKNSQDLAATVSILRDPRFETLRAIVVQEGKIVAASDLSSRLPAAVAFTEDFYDRAISLAKKAGGGNLYLLHNHPSGDPEPSDQDVQVTKALGARLQNSTAAAEASQEVTFGGHVVIDGDRYGFMAPGGGKFVQDHYDQDKLGSFRDTSTHPLLGIKINGPESLALAGKAICESEKEPDSTYMIMTDSVGRVSLGISVSGDLIPEGEEAESPDTARFRGWARNLSRASGSKMRFLVVPKKLYDEKKHQFGALIRSGLFTDILVKETSTSVMNALMIQPGMTKDPVLRIRRQATKVNESMETTKSRIIQIVKSALADKSHLVRKVITNKLGRKQTVLVRADEAPAATESMPDAKVEGFRNADYGNGRNIEIEDLKGISKTLDWLIDKAQKHVLSTDSETNGTRSRTEVFRVRLSIRQKKFFHAMDSTIKKLQKIFGSNHFTNKDGSREFLVSIEKEPVSGASYANFKFLQTVPLEPSDGGSIDYFAANEFIRSLPTTEEKDFAQAIIQSIRDGNDFQKSLKYIPIPISLSTAELDRITKTLYSLLGEDAIQSRQQAIEQANDAREATEVKKSRVKESVSVAKGAVGVITQHKLNEEVRQILQSTAPDKMTGDQKALLRKYEGWGGQTRNDKTNYDGKGLLYEFYTPENVVKKSWEIIDRYLKPGSEILEPCAGTGRFAEGKSSYKFDLIEIDETSSKIAGILNPGATVTTGQFETLFLDDRNRSKKQYDGKLYDAVVTNPPYGTMGGKYKATEGRGWQRYEEYFIHRSLDTVKEGGIVAMVVPSAFLRKGMTKSKEKIFAKAELLEAHRLPNGAFANTQIGTDLVILRKNTTPDKDVSNAAEDRYFKNNPDHLHGTEIDTLDRFGKPDKQVKGRIDQFLNHQPGKAKALSDTHKKAIAEGLLGNKNAAGKHRKAATNRKVTRTRTVSNATRKTKNSSTRNIQPPKILSQQEFNQKYGLSFSEKEIQMMRSSNALGYVDHEIPFDGSIMSYHSGGHLPDYLYATGNIYERLEQLEQDREEILEKYGLEQFQKQHNMLRDAVPPHVKAQDIIFDPIDPFCQGMTFADSEGEDDTMVSRFKDWVRSLDYEMFRGYNATRGDVSAYCDGRPVTGNDKRRNEAIRRERKMLSQKLMEKYVKDFLPESERKQIEDAWNRKFNAYVEVDPARVPLPIEGLNSKFKGKDYDLRDVQHHFAATFLTKGVGCAAHEVGLGKTMTGIISTASNMQIGRCKRPLFTVPSSTLSEWEASAKSLYPNMSINVIGTNELNRMTAGGKKLEIPEGSMTIMSYDAFARLGFTEERFEELTKELQDAHGNPYEKDGPTVTVDGLKVKVQIDNSLMAGKADKRKAAKAKEKAEALASKALKGTQKNLLFDEIGFDHLTVDEAHNFNNIFGDVKGTDESGKKTRVANEYQGILGAGNVSDRGMKLFVAAQHILKTNENRNVLLLTATPFTNNPLQVYSLLSVMAKERLNEMGIRNVKDFVSMFVETQREITMEANGNVKERQTVRRFKNGHAFANLINEFFDRKTGEQANIQRPDLVEKEIVLPATDEMNRMRQSLEEYYDKAFAPDANERDPSAAIKSMTLQQNLNVSPGLVKDFQFNESGSSGFVERSPKLKFVAKSAVEYYKRMQSAQGTPPGQIIFMPRGVDYFNQIKEYMIKQGIPEEAIQIMTPAEKNKKSRNPANKAQGMSRFDEIKFDFNDPNGKTKIVIGSDAIQEGVNLQENTGVMYNCLLSWNPTNNEQKKGRGWRQGNQQKTTHMFYPVIENSIDTKLFQKHAEKVSRINDIFKTTGSPFIETAEINPDELKFEIITDPVKRARLVAAETEKQKFAAIQDRITDKNMLQSILNRSETLDDRVDAAQKQVDKYAEWSSEGSDYWKEALSKEKALLARLKRDRSNLDSMLQEKGYSAESLSKRIGEMDREIAVMQDDATKKKEDLEKELTERFTREQEEAAKSRPKESLDEMVESHVSKLVASSLGHQVYKSNLWDLVFRGRKGAANAKRYQAATA